MKLEIFATKDTMVGAFMNPFYMHNSAEAKRNWGGSIAYELRKENPAPEIKDLQLYKLGEFDDETGVITSDVQYIAKAMDFYEGGAVCNTTQKAEDQKQ